ncbi:MAG: hypothetical protein LBS20_19760 [Prevotella sp.]|jgi:hypothetical protein|nr:hypothetical protein [Prevotella sp.]
MEKEERSKYTVRLFTFLMKHAISPIFVFPGGGISQRTVSACMDSLEVLYKSELSEERLTDYCICQVYTVSQFDSAYLRKWSVSHSFGEKAVERFAQNTQGKRYYEELWLKKAGLSRGALLSEFKDKSLHPLYKFIYPDYEDPTKSRVTGTETGFYICRVSTLMWTPFSPVCRNCDYGEKCKEITSRKYAELFRIRNEEYNKKETE